MQANLVIGYRANAGSEDAANASAHAYQQLFNSTFTKEQLAAKVAAEERELERLVEEHRAMRRSSGRKIVIPDKPVEDNQISE